MRDTPPPHDPGAPEPGSADFQKRLLEEHYRRLFGLCWQCLQHQEEAEDTMNDIIVLVLRKWHQYNSAHPFWPWLRLVAVRYIASKTRAKAWKIHKKAEAYDDAHGYEAEPEPLDEIVTGEDRQLVQESLATLPEHLRSVLVFFHFEELSLKEISELVGRPVGTIGRWLQKARESVQQIVEQHHPAGVPVLPNR